MTSEPRPIRRPPVQRDYLARVIRQQIVEGRFAPGSKLPARPELLRRYGTAPGTIQSAFDQLSAQGFIERRPRQGVFVASNPPHLFRYGVVFQQRPARNVPLTYFFQALMDEAKQNRSRQIDLFYNVDPSHDRDREAYQDLLETVVNDRIAGLVFTFSPFMLRSTPVIQKPRLPRVGIMGAVGEFAPNMSPVYVDYAKWMTRALDVVKSRGLRRVALLATPGFLDRIPNHFERGVAERNLNTRELWVQGVRDEMGFWIARVVRLMLDAPPEKRPQALLIADDNLLEEATKGLVEAGLRTPEDVFVVAHTNFPRPAPAACPVTRLGFDVRAVLQNCWELIDLQRRGEKPKMEVRLVPPIFEHEFNPAPLVAARESSHV